MELLTNIYWLMYRKMPHITITHFVIIFFMFLPYTPILIATADINNVMTLAQWQVYMQSAMMIGVILFIVSGMALWMYGKFVWKRLG